MIRLQHSALEQVSQSEELRRIKAEFKRVTDERRCCINRCAAGRRLAA